MMDTGTVRECAIPRELSSLTFAIESNCRLVEEIETRLRIVMRMPPPVGGVETQPQKMLESCDMSNTISEKRKLLEINNKRLEDILSRIEF